MRRLTPDVSCTGSPLPGDAQACFTLQPGMPWQLCSLFEALLAVTKHSRPGSLQDANIPIVTPNELAAILLAYLTLTFQSLHFLPTERSAQAAEAAREKAGGVMGAVRDATLNTAQQTREMFDALQQKTLDTVVRVLAHGAGESAPGGALCCWRWER